MKMPDGEYVETDVLRAELERALGEAGCACPRIAHLERRAARYRTSFALEELQVSLEDGRQLSIMWKDLHSLGESSRQVKPEFLYNPAREIETYRRVLAPHRLGTPMLYGAVVQATPERYWLFLERVEGTLLWQVGDFEIWQQVAQWLARMHAQLRGQICAFEWKVPLLVYNAAFYRQWMTRARQFAVGTNRIGEIEWLAERHDLVIDRLLALRPTLLHGEFYPSNILVAPRAEDVRICPVDWEMAAIGPGPMDLAALVAGSWSEEEKRNLASAYYSALPMPREWTLEEFLEALDYCRLQVAVQWLGWSPAWTPPAEHDHDWLREAMALADKL